MGHIRTQPALSSLQEHASILMAMRYIHPTAEQKRGAIQKFDKYPAQGFFNSMPAKQLRQNLQSSLQYAA